MNVIHRVTRHEYGSRDEAMNCEPIRHITNPSWADFEAIGWADVVPFSVPAGCVIRGNRRVEPVDGEERELYDVWTPAERDAYNAQQAAAAEAIETARLAEIKDIIAKGTAAKDLAALATEFGRLATLVLRQVMGGK